MNFNKNNYLKINSGAKPSCFVVDLKQNLIKKNVEENIDLGKSAKIDYKKYFRTKKEKIKNFIQVLISKNKIFDFYSNSFKKKILLPKSAGKTDKFLRKLDQLAFVGLGKLICAIFQNFFILFYKTCHQVGWTTLFLIRFIYFVLALLLKLIARTVKALIIFIGKIIFYSVVELRKINYKFWTAIVRSWRAIKQKIYFKAAIINKIFEQKKFLISRSVKAFVNIFKINKINSNRQLSVKNFLPRLNLIHLKPVGIFALILLIFVLPFQANIYYKSLNSIRAQVLGEGGQAISQFLSAGQSAVDLDFNQAQLNFTQASDNFSSAQTKLSEINGLLLTLTAIAPDKNLRLAAIGKRILQAGELSADIGKNLSLAINPSFSLYKEGGLSLKEILDNFRLYGRLSADQALELNNLLNAINKNDLQDKYSQQFILLKEKTAILANSLNKLINLADKTDSFLGAASDKRYLLVFQNNTEMRASGGFIGSYALVDFSNCKLKNIEAPGGGSYDVEAGMLDKIIAPHPLQLIAPQWYFWDANWWADWPTSANKLMWFYEKSNGPTVDGVISFTPTVMEELLKIIGPIDLTEQYGAVFDADNFWLKTQELIKQKAGATNQPKKIINDLMNKIIAELPNRITKDNLLPLLKITDQLLSSKQILFYFTDADLENEIIKLGWDGGFKETAKDYLSVINTNIAGGKSDKKIKETIEHQAKIMPDGTIINTVKITRAHTAVAREPFSGVRNVDWMRIYVPKGSQLIEAQGFKAVDEIYFKKPDSSWLVDKDISKTENNTEVDEKSGTKIYQELDKTVFANWSQVDPGQSVAITLKYKLPFKINETNEPTDQSATDKIINNAMSLINPGQKQLYAYSLLVQKQPGAKVDQITADLILNNFSPIWKYPKGLTVNQTGWQISDDLDSDKFWAVVLEEK